MARLQDISSPSRAIDTRFLTRLILRAFCLFPLQPHCRQLLRRSGMLAEAARVRVVVCHRMDGEREPYPTPTTITSISPVMSQSRSTSLLSDSSYNSGSVTEMLAAYLVPTTPSRQRLPSKLPSSDSQKDVGIMWLSTSLRLVA
jgi:hypothetical protein